MRAENQIITNISPTPLHLTDHLYAPPQIANSVSMDLFEETSTTNAKKAAHDFHTDKNTYLSVWDIPGVLTFSWLKSTTEGLQSKGDYSGPMGRATGGLMVLASPVVIPFSLLADVINTVIFPGKLLYRAISNQ